MMKKIFLMGFTMAALVLTSCSKSDITESLDNGTKLNFRLTSGKTTKSVSENELPQLQAKGVVINSFDKDDSDYNFPFFNENYFDLSWDGNVWSPSKPIFLYTSANYPINLYSVYPSDVMNNGEKSFTFEIDYTSDINKSTDILVATTQILASTETNVSLAYAHALSQIVITARYLNGGADTYAKIQDCKISGSAIGTQTYNFGNGTGSWDSSSLSAVGVEYGGVDKLTTAAGVTELDRFVFFPNANMDKLIFDWGIFKTADDAPIQPIGQYSEDITLPLEAGKRFFIDIIIDGNTATWTVIPTDWIDNDPHLEAKPQ